ncbi:MAG: hypothetical protein AAF721_12355 [Myxococcota bacterium]
MAIRTRPNPALVVVPLIASLALPTLGCGLFRRRGNVSTSANSSVEVNNQGRDLATLSRDEYEIIETSIGEDKQTSVFILTIPVGQQTSRDEAADSAYYAAVDRIPECDVLMMPRVSVDRVLIPLLLVNIVVRKTRVKGRCAHLKGEKEGVVNSRGAFDAKTIDGSPDGAQGNSSADASPKGAPDDPAREPSAGPSNDSATPSADAVDDGAAVPPPASGDASPLAVASSATPTPRQ